MTHVCEMQNEVNPYVVQTGWWFGPKASPEATKNLQKTKAQNRESIKKLDARKAVLKELKATLKAEAQTQKIQDKNKALDAQIRQIDETINVWKGQVRPKQQLGMRGPPERTLPRVPETHRLENGDP